MRGQPQDKLWYEIVPIKLDLLYDFMILQLLFLLKAISNKYVGVWDYSFVDREKTS